MNMRKCYRVILVVGICTLSHTTTRAQTTMFTYQGQLLQTGLPANGNHDLKFALFDALVNGQQIGSTLTRTDVSVQRGLFTVSLDFGVNAFPGADRFLEISVRPHSADPDSPSYTVLIPRQQITPAPYSIRTLSAASADISLDTVKLGGVAASEYVQTTDPRLAAGSPVKQVIRGVVSFTGMSFTEVSQSFSPSIVPGKSVVMLSDSVGGPSSGNVTGLAAIVTSLSASSITISLNWCTFYDQRVSYQIIEYN